MIREPLDDHAIRVYNQNVLKRRMQEQATQHFKKSSQTTFAFSLTGGPPEAVPEGVTPRHQTEDLDVEANVTLTSPVSSMKVVTLSLADVNPFPPLFKILKRPNNLAILFASGECPPSSMLKDHP